MVFNLVEGFADSGAGATRITAFFELMGIPCTGCPSEALGRCLEKGRAKTLLRGAGLPTASFLVVANRQAVPSWNGPWPVFVKPDAEDASLGIDQTSVVNNQEALDEQVARLHTRYGGRVLIEEYLPGPEFNIGLVALPEPEAFPVAEVVFATDRASGTWPILTYDAKWVAGSADDHASPIRCPALIDPDLARKLQELAVDAFRVTGCRDYARVDLRLDRHGEPMILEVNPNPDISPTAGWARGLRVSGRDYGATLADLARQALGRAR